MKEATKRAASGFFPQMLAVTAMLVIASVIFYGAVKPSLRGHRTFLNHGTIRPANGSNLARYTCC